MTYVLTIFAGTGHTAFSMIPVIVEVAKEQHIRPVCPLSIAVVASQIAITASPVSAAVIYMSGVLEPFGWSYPTLLCIWLLTTFVGCMLTSFVMSHIQNMDLDSDPVYKERLAKGLVKIAPDASSMNKALKPFAKRSVAHLPDRRARGCVLCLRYFSGCRPYQACGCSAVTLPL